MGMVGPIHPVPNVLGSPVRRARMDQYNRCDKQDSNNKWRVDRRCQVNQLTTYAGLYTNPGYNRLLHSWDKISLYTSPIQKVYSMVLIGIGQPLVLSFIMELLRL